MKAVVQRVSSAAVRVEGATVSEIGPGLLVLLGVAKDDGMAEVADLLHDVQPYTAYLSIPTRPPAENWACIPDEAALNRTYQVFADRLDAVEYLIGYEGDAFALTGEIEKDLLSITAVHPMREEAVRTFLSRAGKAWEVVDRLVAQGDLARTTYAGQIFYLRRFRKNRREEP